MQEIKPSSFIFEIEHALTPETCREMIRRFEDKRDQQYPGRIGQGADREQSVKRSTDLRISGRPDWKDIDTALVQSLMRGFNEAAQKFPFFAANSFKDMGYNLQRTEPGEYYHWHVDGGPGPFSQRQLVAIWYLNDVPGPGGETEFSHQEIMSRRRPASLFYFHRFGPMCIGVLPSNRELNILPPPGSASPDLAAPMAGAAR